MNFCTITYSLLAVCKRCSTAKIHRSALALVVPGDRKRYRKFTFATALVAGIAGNTQALDFEFINDSAYPLNREQLTAVNQAAELWRAHFSDPITVRINIGWRHPDAFEGDNHLASVRIGRTTVAADLLFDSLLAEADASESSLILSLPEPIPVLHSAGPRSDITLPLANAKALSVAPAYDPAYGEVLTNYADAQISFNLAFLDRFAFDPEKIAADQYDFIGVVSHEIGHLLGFTSVVDLQALNAVTLEPTLLDMFRFPHSGTVHMPWEQRQTTPGFAEFFDTAMNYFPFSAGMSAYDPHCALPMNRCNASHWRDSTDTLMISAQPGKALRLAAEDIHALDRIGIDSRWRNGIPVLNARLEFYPLITGAIPPYDKHAFNTKTDAPKFSDLTLPASFDQPPTHAFHISMDGHAGAGFAVFRSQQANTTKKVINFNRGENEEVKNQWEIENQPDVMANIPPHLSHFYFESFNQQYRFSFVNTFSNYGAVFDPKLGKYGGFRLSGFLDGNLDGGSPKKRDGKSRKSNDQRRDYDASVTLLMVFDEPHDISKGITTVTFSLLKNGDKHVQDNMVHIIDNHAFSLPTGYGNAASYKEALEKRIEQLVDDPEPGRDISF